MVGQRLEPDRAVLACRVLEADDGTEGWCRRCGCAGRPRDTVTRELAHEPLGWRPTTLLVTIRRYRCTGCGHVWRQDTSRAAEPRARLSRRGLAWALEAIVCQHLSIARVAQGLGVAWNTANDAVLAEGRRVLINDPGRLNGVKVIGVDEHVWRHTRRGDKYVTVIIDLTPVRAGTGPARLLDMIPGRSKAAYKEVVRVGHGSKACDRSWNEKREIMRIELGKAPGACTYTPPVQGDAPQPDHRFDVAGRILKNTADNIRDDAYLSIAIRVGGGKRYELRVFPKGKEFQLRRQPSGAGFPNNGSNPAIGKIGKLNQLRLRAEGSQVTASVNGTQVASVNDGDPGQLSGAKVEFGVGNVGNSKKDTLATFDKLKLAVPDP